MRHDTLRQLLLALTLATGLLYHSPPSHQHPSPFPHPQQQRTGDIIQQRLLNLGIGILYGVEKDIKIGKCRQRLNLGRLLEGRSRPYSRCRY